MKQNDNTIDEYVSFLNKKISSYHEYIADTIYFGGGTPSILGTERILSVLKNIHNNFGNSQIETTLEVNPESAYYLDFEKLKYYGINRISIGLQSANEKELKALGRTHSAQDVANIVESVMLAGINNISLDLMIGISEQNEKSLSDSIHFCSYLDVQHISAYILKIEKGTLYFKKQDQLLLPDDDAVCDLYEMMVRQLRELGYNQYEISNFARQGFESRHNLKYWNCEEYLGLGASAHSFIDKKRFYYPRSIKAFYNNNIISDGIGGDEEEYIAMTLRLTSGLEFSKFKKYFGYDLPTHYIIKARKLDKTELLFIDSNGIRLSEKGFLCSNSIIAEIIS